jgi:hypothetical protein
VRSTAGWLVRDAERERGDVVATASTSTHDARLSAQ